MEKLIYQMEQTILMLQRQIPTQQIDQTKDILPEYLRIMKVPSFISAKLKAIQYNQNYEVKEAVFKEAQDVGNDRIYQGQWYQDKKNGRGQEYNQREQKYFYGYWKDGVFVQGLIIKEQDLFEGNALDDNYQYGVLVLSDEKIYKGKFLAGKLNDENGYYRSPSETYIGGFVKGQKHGKGKYENDDIKYEGEFFDDKICGQGILIEKKNGWKQDGQFKDGLLNGKGVYVRSLEDYYEGFFKQGLRHGKGTMKRSGLIYQGNFIEGKLDGWAQLTQDKRVFKCFFQEGIEDNNKRQLIQ